MKVYKAIDLLEKKKEFIGTAKEIVRAMAQADYITPQKDVWMYEVQERLLFAHGKKIKVVYGLYTGFLKELARVQVIKLQKQVLDEKGHVSWEDV